MLSEMGALIVSNPDEARKKILDALRQTNGNRKKAAPLLGLKDPRSLFRWIEKLGLWAEVDKMAEGSDDIEKPPGPPRSKERVRGALTTAKGDLKKAARALDMTPSTLKRRVSQLGLDAEVK